MAPAGKNVAVNSRRRGHTHVMIGEPNLVAELTAARRDGAESDVDDQIEHGEVDHIDVPSVDDVGRMVIEESDEDLYVRLAPDLIRFATSLVGPSNAEDLLATAVTKAMSSTPWSRVDNRRAYLYRMLVNEAHKARRTASRRRQREIRVVHRGAIDLERGLDPDVMAALKRLSVRQRAVVYLTYWADLTPRQVADTLDTSLRTVERELANARTRLEQMLS